MSGRRCGFRPARPSPGAAGVAAGLAAAWAVCLAASPPGAQTFRSRVETVQVMVTVTDAAGRFVTGLTRGDFQVFEEGVEQRITLFSNERVPISLGVLLDASDSMRGRPMVDARAAVVRFVADLLQPGDEAFIATFNHRVQLVAPWTRPPAALRDALGTVAPSGGTAMYDAVALSASLFDRREHQRAALVVISDGADTASDRTLLQALDAVRRSDVLVYAVAIDDPAGRGSTRVNPDALRELTGLAGGYTEVVREAAELGPATERIAEELDRQYALGYVATRPPDDTWRAIRVRVRDRDVTARSRRGYFAGAGRE